MSSNPSVSKPKVWEHWRAICSGPWIFLITWQFGSYWTILAWYWRQFPLRTSRQRNDFITIAIQQREKYFLCIRNLNYTKFNAFHRVFKQIDLFPSVHAMTAHGDKTISFLLKLGWVPYLLHAQEQSILTFSRCEIWRCSCKIRYCPIIYRNVDTWCNLQCTKELN